MSSEKVVYNCFTVLPGKEARIVENSLGTEVGCAIRKGDAWQAFHWRTWGEKPLGSYVSALGAAAAVIASEEETQ